MNNCKTFFEYASIAKRKKDPQWYSVQEGDATMITIAS